MIFFYAADIYDKVSDDFKKLNLDGECVGGGRINHDPEGKKLKVYGYSTVITNIIIY